MPGTDPRTPARGLGGGIGPSRRWSQARGEPAPRVSGARARMDGRGRRPSRGELRLLGQSLPPESCRGAPFEIFLSAGRGAGARSGAHGAGPTARARSTGVGRLALLVPPALAARARPLAGRPRGTPSTTDACAGSRSRIPAHAPLRPCRTRGARRCRGSGRGSTAGCCLAENAAQAVQFALARGADGRARALGARASPSASRAEAPHVLPRRRLAPPRSRRRMVLLAPADADAHALYRFLAGAKARAIFERSGFAAP